MLLWLMKLPLKYIFLILFFSLFSYIIFYKILGITGQLNIAFIKNNLDVFKNNVKQEFILYFVCFFLVYFAVTTFSIPIASMLSIFIGAIFEFFPSLILVSFASSLGAVLNFLLARVLLKKYLEKKFKKYLLKINRGLKREGLKYLFLLRLIPVIPFFLINLLFGITNIRVFQFYIVSQLGMLPATILYINAGKQIGSIDNINDIMSFNIILAFILIGIFPLLIKKLYTFISKAITL